MALTNSDLQAIDKIVANRIGPLEKGQANLEKNYANLAKGQKKIASELNKWTKFFDRDYVKLLRRVVRIENKLDISPPEF